MLRNISVLLLTGISISMAMAAAGQEQLYVYPMWDQTDEQKRQDKLDCYNWAAEASGVDPIKAAMDRSQVIREASLPVNTRKGGGSLARREAKEQKQQYEQESARAIEAADAEYRRRIELFNPPYIECLGERGYSVR